MVFPKIKDLLRLRESEDNHKVSVFQRIGFQEEKKKQNCNLSL